MSWAEYGLTSYHDYFNTKHWNDLKEELLWKRGTECWICGKWSKLLIHHISYKNLFHEKLYRDVYILCFDCHNQVHFWTDFDIRVPLIVNWLLFSMRARKLIKCIQKGQFSHALLWFSVLVILVPIHITRFVFQVILTILGRISWHFLKLFLSKLRIDIT